MSWIRNGLVNILLLMLVACQNKSEERETRKVTNTRYLIEASELLPIIGHDTIAVIDLQRPEDYLQGHLPGAINLWRSALNNESFKYNGMIPERKQLERVLSERGIPSDAFLILYDNLGSCEATRLWWVLNQYGHNRMAILNGGTQSWGEISKLDDRVVNRVPTEFTLQKDIELASGGIQIEELTTILNKPEVLVLDTRTTGEHTGTVHKTGAMWAGHIPGSIHIDWMSAVDPSNYRFKNRLELQKIYKEWLSDDPLIITYCHSGVRSTHTYFVLTELLGYQNVRNFDGSWVEWTHHFQPETVN